MTKWVLIVAILMAVDIARAAGPLSITELGAGRFLRDDDGSGNAAYTISVFFEPANSGGCAAQSNEDMHHSVQTIFSELTEELQVNGKDVSPLEIDSLLEGMTDNTGKPVTYDVNGTNFADTVYVMNNDPLNSPKVSNGQTILLYDVDGSITAAVHGEGNRCQVLGFAGMVFPSNSTDPEIEKGQMVVNCAAFNRSICPESSVDADDQMTVIKHEFMHMMGMDHTQLGRENEDSKNSNRETVATMYPHLLSGKEQSLLNKDDVVTFALLYPSSAFHQEFGEISGRVIDENGTEIPCVEVLAENVTDTADVVNTMTGYAAPIASGGSFPDQCIGDCGGFTLSGLLGTYRLTARNIRPEFDGSSSIGRCKPPILYDLDGDNDIEDNETIVLSSPVSVVKGEDKSNVVIQTSSLATTSGGSTETSDGDDKAVTSVCSLYPAARASSAEIIASLFFIFTALLSLATGRRCVTRKP